MTIETRSLSQFQCLSFNLEDLKKSSDKNKYEQCQQIIDALGKYIKEAMDRKEKCDKKDYGWVETPMQQLYKYLAYKDDCTLIVKRVSSNQDLVEFLDYFGRFSTSNLGGYIHCRYCPRKV